MSEKMREAVQKAVQKSALRAMQDMWDDLDKAGTVPCLMGYYSDRLAELESLLSALPQQVKSEDARDRVIVGTLRINEYHEYEFVPADLITLERALPAGTYELTAAISAQERTK